MLAQRHGVLFAWLALAVAVVSPPSPLIAAGATFPKVTAISVAEDGGQLLVRVSASGPIRYQTVIVRPDWIVVDVKAAELADPPPALPSGRAPIRLIRVAQYAPGTVRVVVELDHAVQTRLGTSPDGRALLIGIPAAARDPIRPPRPQAAAGVAGAPQQASSEQPARQTGAPAQPRAASPHGSATPVQEYTISVQPPTASSEQSPAGGAQASPPQAAPEGYVLGPDDVLEVRVWGYSDLTTTAAVRPDGRIALPLAGSLSAAGMRVSELTQRLTRAYAEYIIDPQVTVIVKEFRKIHVSVLGQVAHPGTYTLMPGARLIDALSAAGGATEVANLDQAHLVQHGGRPRVVNLQQALAGDASANVVLGGDDTLVVPEDLTNIVSVAGEVMHPGRFHLKGEMRVLDALLLAGGLKDHALVTEVRLTRASGARTAFDFQQLLLKQDMSQNVVLQPGDTLVVPEDPNNKIYVVGDVRSPGAFPLEGHITVLRAIAMAGGPVQHGIGTAKTAHIVRRTQEGGPDVAASTKAVSVQKVGDRGVVMTVDLRAVQNGDLSGDEPLRAGDVVVVPETTLSALPMFLSIIGTIFLGIHL